MPKAKSRSVALTEIQWKAVDKIVAERYAGVRSRYFQALVSGSDRKSEWPSAHAKRIAKVVNAYPRLLQQMERWNEEVKDPRKAIRAGGWLENAQRLLAEADKALRDAEMGIIQDAVKKIYTA